MKSNLNSNKQSAWAKFVEWIIRLDPEDKVLMIGASGLMIVFCGVGVYAMAYSPEKLTETHHLSESVNFQSNDLARAGAEEGEEPGNEKETEKTDQNEPTKSVSSNPTNEITSQEDNLANNDDESGNDAPTSQPDEPSDPGWVWDETPPVLTHSMVSFGPYNSETGKAGDFVFDPALDQVLGVFGRTVSSPGGPKVLPTYDYFVTLDTPIYAPTGGEVVMFTYQESTNDYEILIRPVFNSVWLINYDHLRNVPSSIQEGSQISAGQYIGTPGSWFSNGIVELMVTRDEGDGAVGYCPYDFFSSSLKASFTANLNTLMSEWETFKGDSEIYNESGMVKPGCLTSTAPA